MKRFTRLLAATTAALAIAGVSNAQFGSPQPGTGTLSGPLAGAAGPAYDHHWHSAASQPTFLWDSAFLWTFFNAGAANVGGPGDAIRICFGIDVTQGGRNWSAASAGATSPGPGSGSTLIPSGASSENTWFRWTQGFSAFDAGVEFGLVSVTSGSTSSQGGDACFSPFFNGFPGVPDSGGFKLGAVAIGGFFSVTAPGPFPAFWEFSFTWGPTPVLVPNHVGNDAFDPGIPTYGDLNGDTIPDLPPVLARNITGVVAPLLANVIYEVQAPVNSALNNTDSQYYLGSTVEFMAIGAIPDTTGNNIGYIATGGAGNGNGNQAFDIFGVNAGVTSATNSGRVLTASPSGGFINMMPGLVFPANQVGPPFNFRDGRHEFLGQLAFATPKLWAYHNFDAGNTSGQGSNTLGMPVSFSALGAGHVPPGFGAPGFATDAFGGQIGSTYPLLEGRDGDNGYLLFTGNGGPDWAAAVVPLSRIDLVGIDHEGGAESQGNIYNKVGIYALPNITTPTTTFFPATNVVPPAAFDTTIGVGGFYIGGAGTFECNALTLMAYTWTCQIPNLGLLNSFHPQASGLIDFDLGSFTWTDGSPTNAGFGIAATTKEGTQVLPQMQMPQPAFGFVPDVCFFPFLAITSFTFSSFISGSDDFFADGPVDYAGAIPPSFSSVFEGMWTAETSGQTDLAPGGAQLFVGFGQGPYLRGTKFHLAGQNVVISLCGGGTFITSVTNGLTLNTQ